MITKTRATLRHHLETRPLCLARDKSGVPCALVSAALESAFPSAHKPDGYATPESEALEFYYTNHVVSLIRQRRSMDELLTPAEVSLLNAYHRINNRNLIHAFYYVLLIIHREMRHFQSDITPYVASDCKAFIKSLRGDGGETAASMKFGASPPQAAFGTLIESLASIYNDAPWHSSSYGGPAWGNIADCLLLFVRGEYTGEMFLDTVWTLCHNNGPVFNKGMVYKNHGSELLSILNVQAAGKIPQMVGNAADHGITSYVTPELFAFRMEALKLFPDALSGQVGNVLNKGHQKKHHAPKTLPVSPDYYTVPGILNKAKEVRDDGKK